MKIHYLGTAAAERVPALFCDCKVCNHARTFGGKNLRTQMQTILDDGELMIDFPGDSYLHVREHNLNFNNIKHLLITHWHSDHFYGEDLAYRMSSYANGLAAKLDVYGNSYVKKFYDRAFRLEEQTEADRLEFHLLEPFQQYQIGEYRIHTLPAEHGHRQQDCFIYVIEREGKSLFYTHDTGFPSKEVLDYLEEKEIQLDIISLDCTGQGMDYQGGTHMNLGENLRLVRELIKRGVCNKDTILVASHFSHNGGLNHEEMELLAKSHGVLTAYDGMKIEI